MHEGSPAARLVLLVTTAVFINFIDRGNLRTGLFDVAFALAAGVNVPGLIGWVLMLGKIAPIQWATMDRAFAAGPEPETGGIHGEN
jgi:hypothetical protein